MQDATALAAAIRRGAVKAGAVMEASLAACETQAGLGAVVHLDVEMGHAGAAAADAVVAEARGVFHGVPFLIKDLGSPAKGLPASAGSAVWRDRATPAEADSDMMAALRGTGLIPFGVSATPPFGLSLSSEPEGLPPGRNPWDPALTPGGSSGGAAAAVAAGLVAMAHATDAAGSIRVPAACCGLTGLKPSRGAVPAAPDFNNHLMGIAAELVLARTIRDVATAFAAVSVQGGGAPLPEVPRIGISLPADCGAAQVKAVRDMGEALADGGCQVFEIPGLDSLGAEAHRIAWTILGVSSAEWLDALELADHEVPPLAGAIAAKGRETAATTLFAATRDMARLSFEAARLFADCDAILTPVLSAPPPPVGAFDHSTEDVGARIADMARFAPNAALANVAGLAALALPFGMDEGLPLGGQLLGPQGSDSRILKLGGLIEARAPALNFPHPIAGLPL